MNDGDGEVVFLGPESLLLVPSFSKMSFLTLPSEAESFGGSYRL